MTRPTMQLSFIEENTVKIPEDIQRIQNEAVQVLWQFAHGLAQKEVEKIKLRYQEFEAEAERQKQAAFVKVEQTNEKINQINAHAEGLQRELKSLQVDNTQKTLEIKQQQGIIQNLEEKLNQREHEVRVLHEEIGKLREASDAMRKRLYELERQAEQERQTLREAQEENGMNIRTRERLEKNLKAVMTDSEQLTKQLKIEQTKTSVAEAQTAELRGMIRKLEEDILSLKEERQELKDVVTNEIKQRQELEKKASATAARAEAQEWASKENLSKLEKDLIFAREENATLRNRMVKAEGALEREQKARERLENKLAATGNPQSNTNTARQ